MINCLPFLLLFIMSHLAGALTKQILVTGGNKGIGLALCHKILERADTLVFLGSRDAGRGATAVDEILKGNPGAAGRVECLELDVSSDASVSSAFDAFSSRAETNLYAIVNNAGIGFHRSVRETTQTNYYGPVRINEKFSKFLTKGEGRILNIGSGSAPNFVQGQSDDKYSLLTSDKTTLDEIDDLIRSCEGVPAYENSAYGFSKACLNAYTGALQRKNPDLVINSVTPGWIATDLTSGMGAKNPPVVGTRPILKLLFEEVRGRGWYYGSDGERSPLDVYREPGSAPYAP